MYFFLSHLLPDVCYSSVIVPRSCWRPCGPKRGPSASSAAPPSSSSPSVPALSASFGSGVMAHCTLRGRVWPLLPLPAILLCMRPLGLVAGPTVAPRPPPVRTGCAFLHLLSASRTTWISSSVTSHLLLKLACSETRPLRTGDLPFSLWLRPACQRFSYPTCSSSGPFLRSCLSGWQSQDLHLRSHITAVALFFGISSYSYLKGNMGKISGEDKVVSVFYTVVIPC